MRSRSSSVFRGNLDGKQNIPTSCESFGRIKFSSLRGKLTAPGIETGPLFRPIARPRETGSSPFLRPRQRRTGRNVQLNIKATAEVVERFVALSDRRRWALGETLEYALAALEKALAK